MDKSELKYNQLKDKLKLKGNYKVEYPMLVLKAEIEEIKAAAKVAKTKDVVPGKGSRRSLKITSWMNTPTNNGKIYKE